MKRQMMMLANLTCPSCGGKLEAAAGRLPGVKSARVAFGTGALHIEYDETQLTEAQIRTVIKQQGLDVTMVMAGK
jgi:copper chaperone CopZ